MPRPLKKRDPNRHADRFYEYLMAHRAEVFRYVTVALVTALVQFALERLIPAEGYGLLLPLAVRFLLMFYALKYWTYREIGSGGFYTARQMMIAVMAVLVSTWVVYQLIIFVASMIGSEVIVRYVGLALLEIVYFILYQFLIFKEPKND